MRRNVCLVMALTWGMTECSGAFAQQVTTRMPLQHAGSSFFEQSNVSWSMNTPHYSLSFNGGGTAPPFGGFNPNAGINGGFAAGDARFNFGFAQGASLSSSTFAPMLTTTSGYPGSLFVGTVRPFVIGAAPVVAGGGGGNIQAVGPLAQRIANGQLRVQNGKLVSAVLDEQGVPPAPQPPDFAKQLAQRQAGEPLAGRPAAATTATERSIKSPSREMTAEKCLERGEAAEKSGRLGVAKVYYQLAIAKGTGLTPVEARVRLEALEAKVSIP